MSDRPPEHLTEQRLLLRGWRHVIAGQAVITLLMLPLLRPHPVPTLFATAFNLLAIAITIRIRHNRATTANRATPGTSNHLAAVAACAVGSALWARALTLWPR